MRRPTGVDSKERKEENEDWRKDDEENRRVSEKMLTDEGK